MAAIPQKSLSSSAAIELAVIPVCLDASLETGEMRAGDRQWGSRSQGSLEKNKKYWKSLLFKYIFEAFKHV